MTDLNQASSLSETAPVSSGSLGEVKDTLNTEQQQGTVSYDTHKRLLSEKKKLQERLEQVETEWRSKKEIELKEQNQWKTLYEQEQKERETLHSRLSEQEQRWNNAIKLDSFMQAMGSRKIDSKYANFINLDTIALDQESGQVDALSVQREVDRICREYPEIVRGAVQAKQLPADAPRNPLQGSDSFRAMSSKEKIRLSAEMLTKQLIKS